ncbi:MAG: uncharacterized protein JWN48_4984 [Myxococcaceae bacterium]|nr:uncharacterized protein [Myxococcaceae bacterium]
MTPEAGLVRKTSTVRCQTGFEPRRRRLGALWLGALLLSSMVGVASAEAPTEARRDRVYLTQLGLLADGARRLIAFAESNIDDRELIKFARPLAERYVEMAGHMLPPGKTAVVHPHLLLVVENLERALDSAAAADMAAYQKRMRIARDELANLEAVLKQLKLRLPEPAR